MLKNYKIITFFYIILFVLFYANDAYGDEIIDNFNNTYQTDHGDPSLVKFVRIKGNKVPIYNDNSVKEIIQYLTNKQFVQFLDKNGKFCHVRVYHPEGSYEGWINKFKVYNTKGAIRFYFGKPFLMKSDEAEIDPNEIEFEVNKTAWIMKDSSKLLELPKDDSRSKFDIYFGKELFLKKQKGDYYLVEIRNNINDEVITGWVKIEDVGNKEFYFAKYDRSMSKYQQDNNSLETEISELETYNVELNKELEDLENELQILNFQKEANIKILNNSTINRKNYLLKEMKIAEEIEESVKIFKEEIISLRSKISTLDKGLEESINSLFELNADNISIGKLLDQNKRELATISPKLKDAYEQKKIYYLAHKEEIDRKNAEKAKVLQEKELAKKKTVVKEALEEKSDNTSTEECLEFERLYKEKLAEFEEVKEEMSKGDISKADYERLYELYTNLWNEAGQCKKQLKECEFNQNSKHIALFNEAIGLKKEEEYDDAMELLFQAIEIKNDFEEAYFQIVLILIELDNDSEIDKYLNKITDTEKKGQLLNRRASCIKNNSPEKAIKYYQEMAKYYKPDLAYFQTGVIYLEKFSDKQNAIKYFKKALAKDSKDPKIYEALGAVILETKPPKGQSKNSIIEEAISYFEKGLKYGNDYSNIHILCARLAQAYNELGMATSALKYADMAIDKAPNNNIATGFLEKGIALVKMDKKKEAEKYLNKANNDLLTKDQATFWLKELKK